MWCFSGTNINFLQKLATDFSGSNFWSLFLVSTTIKRHTLENRTIFEENFNGIFLKNPKRHTSTLHLDQTPHPNTTSKIVHLGSKTGGKLFPLKIFIENFENLRQIFFGEKQILTMPDPLLAPSYQLPPPWKIIKYDTKKLDLSLKNSFHYGTTRTRYFKFHFRHSFSPLSKSWSICFPFHEKTGIFYSWN